MSDTLLTPPAPAAPASTPEPASAESAAPTPQADPIVSTPADRDWTQAIKADGSFEPKAHEYGIPEHFKSLGGMFESYQNMQRLKGAPGQEATPEQLTAYRQANGIPEVANVESYGIQLPDELKDAVSPDSLNEIVKVANETAHLGHVEMLKSVVSKFGELEMANLAANAQETEQEANAKLEQAAQILNSDPAFQGDKRTGALQTAANALNSALGSLGVDPNSAEAQDIARNSMMVRILHHFGTKMSQDTTNLGAPNSDLRSGEEQANDIITNPNNPDYKRYHEGDETVAKKVLGLMRG